MLSPHSAILRAVDVVYTRAGDRIFLAQGWWEGKLNGKTGVFPNNFVEELPAGSAPPEPEPEEDAVIPRLHEPQLTVSEGAGRPTYAVGSAVFIQGALVWPNSSKIVVAKVVQISDERRAIQLEFTGDGENPTSTYESKRWVTWDKFDENLASNLRPNSGPGLPWTPRTDSGPEDIYMEPAFAFRKVKATQDLSAYEELTRLDLVKVEFDYNAENEDELNLKKGQFVLVTKRDDQGWWEGGLVGSDKTGMFPDNVVVNASDSEKADEAAKMAPAGSTEPPPPRSEGGKPKVPEAAPVAAAPPATAAAAAGALKVQPNATNRPTHHS